MLKKNSHPHPMIFLRGIRWSQKLHHTVLWSCITQCCGATSHGVVELRHTVLWSCITQCCGATSHSVVKLHHTVLWSCITVLWSYITQCCEATSHSVVELHHSVVELHHTVLWIWCSSCWSSRTSVPAPTIINYQLSIDQLYSFQERWLQNCLKLIFSQLNLNIVFRREELVLKRPALGFKLVIYRQMLAVFSVAEPSLFWLAPALGTPSQLR